MMLLLQGLRRNMRWWWLSPKTTVVVDKDHLSSLPDELILEILTKLDPESLYHCIAASPRFLPYLSKIPSYSTALPSKLIVNGSPKPIQILFEYFCYATGLVLSSSLLYFLLIKLLLYGILSRFYTMLPYSSLILLAGFRPIRPRLRRCCLRLLDWCFDILLHPLSMRLVSSIFRVIGYVMLHHVTLTAFGFLAALVGLPFYLACRIVYSPRISTSGRRVLKGLTGLRSIEVTLPEEVFDDRNLWVRAEKHTLGNMTYEVLVTGRISNVNQHINDDNDVSANIIEDQPRRVFEHCHIRWFMRDFPVPGEAVRVIASKNGGTNTRIRFDLKESMEENESLLERVIKKALSYHSYSMSKRLLTLEEGSLVLEHVELKFDCWCHDIADGTTTTTSTTSDVKDSMRAYLDDDDDDDNTVKRDIKDVLRILLASPDELT